MERRRFLGLFAAGVAGVALDQAIPFNRVWSFPKNIVVPNFVGIDLALGSDLTRFTKWTRSCDRLEVGDIVTMNVVYAAPETFIITGVFDCRFELEPQLRTSDCGSPSP